MTTEDNANISLSLQGPNCSIRCKDTRRDLQLLEAEKTIANKDVIIKMLQEQVKKLEQSYKHNLKETEEFRYKYCLAAEQMKRFRLCPKQKRSKELRDLQNDFAQWKQQCDELLTAKDNCIQKCNVTNFQKIKNLEKFMKSHYEMLQALVAKIMEQRGSNHSLKNTDIMSNMKEIEDKSNSCAEQLALLQEEIARLKDENSKLQNQVSYQPALHQPSICPTDSIIINYKKTNEDLRSKVDMLESILLEEKIVIETEQEKYDYMNGINNEDTFSINTLRSNQKNKPRHTSFKEGASQDQLLYDKLRKKFEQASLQSETDSIVTCTEILKTTPEKQSGPAPPVKISALDAKEVSADSSCESSIKNALFEEKNNRCITSCAAKSGSHCKISCEKSSENEPKKNVLPNEKSHVTISSNDIDELTLSENITPPDSIEIKKDYRGEENKRIEDKLTDIGLKVALLIGKQEATCQELEQLKDEMKKSQKSAEDCNTNISNLKLALVEQKQTLMANLSEHKVLIDSLIKVNDNVQGELDDIKKKLDMLFKNADEAKQRRNTILKEPKPEIDPNASDTLTIEQCRFFLKQEKSQPSEGSSKLTNKSFKFSSSSAEPSVQFCHNNTNDLKDEYCTLKEEESDKNKKIKCMNNLISYYNGVNDQVTKLSTNTPISSSSQKQAESTDETGFVKCCDKLQDQNHKLKATISNVIEQLQEKIDEINEAVPGTSDYCISVIDAKPQKPLVEDENCFCWPESNKEVDIQDIYNAVRSSCSQKKTTTSETYCPLTLSIKSVSWEDIQASRGHCQRAMKSGASSEHCISECEQGFDNHRSLLSNLQSYMGYLHTQLEIITNIENQIENLRRDVAEPTNN